MKHHALFSSKIDVKVKKIKKCCLLQFLFGALRVNVPKAQGNYGLSYFFR